MPEPFYAPKPAAKALLDILAERPVNGVTYGSVQLYGDEFDETVDKDCLTTVEFAAYHWPGGIPGDQPHTFNTVFFPAEKQVVAKNESISSVRKLILGLRVSKRAVRRWNASDIGYLRTQVGLAGIDTDDYLPMLCTEWDVPLAAIVFARVERHKKIKAGNLLAALYCPVIVQSPVYALKALQTAQQKVIDEERL